MDNEAVCHSEALLRLSLHAALLRHCCKYCWLLSFMKALFQLALKPESCTCRDWGKLLPENLGCDHGDCMWIWVAAKGKILSWLVPLNAACKPIFTGLSVGFAMGAA